MQLICRRGSATDVAAQYGLGGIPTGANLGGFPNMNFGGTVNNVNIPSLSAIGVPAYEPSDETQNVGQIIDNVTKVLGRHTVKTGLNFQHVRFYGLQPPNGIGYQNFHRRLYQRPRTTRLSLPERVQPTLCLT